MPIQRVPLYFIDIDGQRCVRIPLASTARIAILYAEDFERLIALGLSPFWMVNMNKPTGQGYVRVAKDGRKLAIARLILGAGPRHQVAYRDGNRLNLRRENLILRRGGTACFDAVALLEAA
jgi:hypothetical protein